MTRCAGSVCIVQIQPKKHVLLCVDHADHVTPPSSQNELDHTDRDREVGIEDLGHDLFGLWIYSFKSLLWEAPKVVFQILLKK